MLGMVRDLSLRVGVSPADAVLPAPPRVLIVDDEPKNLVAMQAILEGPDRELVCANSGEEALRHVLNGDFALIILDVHMPGIDGFDTAELIRQREQTRDTPILFITAAVRGEFAVSRGYSLGAVDYLLRPLEPDVLRFKVGVFVDLYRKTAEIRSQATELARAEAFLTSVLQGATEHAIVALDTAGRIVVWNEGARRIYGYAHEAVAGRHVRMLFYDDAQGALPQALLKHVDRQGRAEGEFWQRRVAGGSFVARITLSRREEASGAGGGYVFVSRDITAERQAEQARAELYQLREANAIKDEFLGLVSHELRTPLTMILGNAQSLGARFRSLAPDVVEESLREMTLNARRLQAMVESMLLLSHLETGHDVESEPVLVQRLVPGIVKDFGEAFEGVDIRLDIDGDLPPVEANSTYVHQIVSNLLSNAVKYGAKGSAIEIVATQLPDAVRVAVLDRGSGITEEEATRIFEPFTRLDRTQFQAAGAGLGLTVCKRLVSALGGSIGARPREGGGSEFAFTLRALDASKAGVAGALAGDTA